MRGFLIFFCILLCMGQIGCGVIQMLMYGSWKPLALGLLFTLSNFVIFVMR